MTAAAASRWAATEGGAVSVARGMAAPPGPGPALEVWGGLECSVIRVGDAWRDQLAETGHDRRDGDLDALAALGLRTLRYAVPWERVSPRRAEEADWARSDARLGRMRALGIRPVLGLLHHGSGPARTQLLDPDFPAALADYAGRAAERYPWVEDWVPVNKPLTTARFSGLYGHWFPHLRDGAATLRMVANQCLGVLLSMRAIRARIPGARLVQTEDIGRVFSTPQMAQQAGHENERRWLSLDLLLGRVGPGDPWWGMLREAGVAEATLDVLRGGEGAPDLLGINHYLTSDRFLDHRLHLHPAGTHGGNGRQAYADTEAFRAADAAEHEVGPGPRLLEVWARYRRPMVVAEAHNGGPDPVERVRWLLDVWQAAEAARAAGADLRAVTAWSLFGAVDWDSLLRERRGSYEAGAFDAGRDPPAPTLVAEAVAGLARDGTFDHPALRAQPGWWRRDDRFPPAVARVA